MWKPPWRIVISSLAALLILVAISHRIHTAHLEARLVRAQPGKIIDDPELRQLAQAVAPVIYRDHCAACHGSNLQGDGSRGAPNLADRVSLYGEGSVVDLETTILYGIRSGHPKARNLMDMPALGRTGQLTSPDVRDVVEFVLAMSGQPHDAMAAERGRAIFAGPGSCYDCHGADGHGIPDYGTPALTGLGGTWLYGGDRQTLYQSVYDGRHGLCPAWIGKLTFVQVRALAVFLYEKSHHE